MPHKIKKKKTTKSKLCSVIPCRNCALVGGSADVGQDADTGAF